MTSRNEHFFHGTKHDIKHLVRPSKDTDLDNYDYDGRVLPKSHRAHTFAVHTAGFAEPTDAESLAWDWARGPGRPRVHTVEPVKVNPTDKIEGDPNVEGAVMHRGAMRIKDTTWIPPISHAGDYPRDANWDYRGPGNHQFMDRTTEMGARIEDRSEHVQGTLPPLNWNQHHAESARWLGVGGIGGADPDIFVAQEHVKRLDERFNPEPEWHGDSPNPDQEALFPRARYRV